MNLKSSDVLDSQESHKAHVNLLRALRWWEKLRLPYNGILLIIGVIGLIINRHSFSPSYFIPIVFYGVLCNLFYSAGFLLESLDNYYFKGKIQMHRFRIVLFVVGLFISALVTLISAIIF